MTKNTLKICLITLIIASLTVGGILFIYSQKQNIDDELALINYHPPSSISTLANQDGMTSYTKKVFYVNHPQIDSKVQFASFCPNNSPGMSILGCYHTGQHGIFILSVNNSELYGIEQVTAAYETLHAIYQRLSPSAQKNLNAELISFENHGLNNSIIKAQIANFRKTEPGEVLNEMTSLFGTEVQNLPPNLTNFYAKYFINRQDVLNYYSRYQAAFTSREQQITTDSASLNSLYAEINSDQNELKSQLAEVNSMEATLQSEKNAGEISQYDQNVPAYNQQVDAYNTLASTLSALVNQYNNLVASRNSLVLEEQQLTQSISSPNYQINN